MIKDIKYTFRIIISDTGSQTPSFVVWPPTIGKYLNSLSGKTNPESIIQIIGDIKNVISGVQEETFVSDGGDCEFKVTEAITQLENYYEGFESVEFTTSSFLLLFEEWLQFINKYNSCQIPGIIPNGKKEELIIVPRAEVKDDYWNNQA